MINKEKILAVLREHKKTVQQRFGVVELSLFGAFARDQADEDSEIEILVRLDKPATFKSFFGAQFYLEDLLGHSVYLVTDKGLSPRHRPRVEKDAIRV